MSVLAVGWALKQTTGSATKKAVLIALADRYHEEGECFPSAALIAKETELSERTVRTALTSLCEQGLVARERRRRKDGSLSTYRYWFPPYEKPSAAQPPAAAAASPPDTAAGRNGVDLSNEVTATTDVVAVRAGAAAGGDAAVGRTVRDVPALTKIDGRNLPLDALTEVTGIQYGSPRLGGAVAALNGTHNRPGIRQLAWEEIVRGGLPVTFAAPEHLETAISDLIRERAAQYRRRWPDVELTPTALLKWWVDLPHLQRLRQPDVMEVAAIVNDELQRMRGET